MIGLWVVLAACGGPADPPAPAPSTVRPVSVPPSSPDERYAACRDRVEGPEAPGECGSDGDCARAGCGDHVCTTTVAALGLTTTCDVPDCADLLDVCGCHDGRCTWSLRTP